jgi:peptidoglycan/LPS O-acetylase OafA/YrhL
MTMFPGYLGRDFEYIDGVYWTLAVELKFYFLLFLLIVFKQLDNIENWLVAWTFGCILAPYVPGLSAITIYPYGPYFIAGSTIFLVWRDRLSLKRLAIIGVCLGLSIYEIDGMVTGWMFEAEYLDPLVSSVIVIAFYIIMLSIALGHVSIGERQFLFKLAMLTYPLYLLHNVIGKAIFDSLHSNKYISLALVLAFIFALSYIAVRADKFLNNRSNMILGRLYQRVFKRKL